MARRWRISQKLTLGLVLAVGILFLLLGGTFRGLWAYHVTTSRIKLKVEELRAAGELKEAIARLVAPENLDRLLNFPCNEKEATRETRGKLDAYQEQLQKSLAQQGDAASTAHTAELVALLRDSVTAFEEQVRALNEHPAMTRPEGQGGQAAGVPAAAALTRDASDLQSSIYKELEDLTAQSRPNYQGAVWILAPAGVVGLLLLIGLMHSFYAWVLNPIRELEAGVKLVAGGNFAHRIRVDSGDEMEELGAAFNDMTQRLQDLYADLERQVNERSRQLVRSERLASVGFLAAGVAHEINNPLASIAFCSEALEARLHDLLRRLPGAGRKGDDAEVFARYLKMIQEEAFRCKNITERLLAFSRTGERRREMTDLAQLVQSVLDVMQHLPNSRNKHIAFDSPAASVTAPVNAEEVKSVVLNLVVNALDSMEEGGELRISLGQQDGMAVLRLTDTGCGMTQEVLENIFEPFFTRSRTGKGTGLGLTISHRIIEQHHGEIEAASAGPDQGSTFTVRLPLQEPPAAEEPARPARPLAA